MATVNAPDTAQSVAAELPPELVPCVDDLVTEDDTPVDNIFSEKQQRLLTEPLYSSWKPGRSFLALANVGMFYALRQPPLVPDALLSLDVEAPADLRLKRNRSYFIWEYGKAPEAVIAGASRGQALFPVYDLSLYLVGLLHGQTASN